MGSDGVFSGQRAAAEYDEDEDEVGEDVVVDQSVTALSYPAQNKTRRRRLESKQTAVKVSEVESGDVRVGFAEAEERTAFWDRNHLLFGRSQVGHL